VAIWYSKGRAKSFCEVVYQSISLFQVSLLSYQAFEEHSVT